MLSDSESCHTHGVYAHVLYRWEVRRIAKVDWWHVGQYDASLVVMLALPVAHLSRVLAWWCNDCVSLWRSPSGFVQL